jgi:lipid A 4'-phosphatase
MLDIKFIKFFYDESSHFIYKHDLWVQYFFWFIPIVTKAFIGLLILLIIYKIIRYRNYRKIFKSSIIYLLLTAAIGPGLIVNSIFKENFNRARPSQISNFNGHKDFSRAFVISDQCETNCSFSSGHAAMAFYFSSLAYALLLSKNSKLKTYRDEKYFNIIYILSLIFGSLVGFSRILMGGHFLSDVTTSCTIILLINYLIFECWKKIE